MELAQEYADVLARRIYREEAKQIEELRKSIIAVSANEEPYDIFICYKETDFNGKRTLDSVLAMDIYAALTDKGYRVFFSRISLEDKLGTEYEPYIFAALNSAKIMLAIGTDYEYFNAVWVKNEWSRFLKLMTQDKTKHLIPCFKGIDAYDMPEEFARLQAQDLDKMGAIQDIVHGVQKLLPKQEQIVKETVVVQQASGGNPTGESYLKRAFMFLEDGDWQSANEYFEKVLDINPENAQAYLGKLMAELGVKKPERLKDQGKPFDSSSNYQKAIRFADDKLKADLTGYIAHINAAIARREEETRIALEKQKEENREKLLRIRQKMQPAQNLLSARTHTVGLCAGGTVWTTKSNEGQEYPEYFLGQGHVTHWRDIVAVAAGDHYTIGVKADGTVLAEGWNKSGQCNVVGWKNIVAASAGMFHTVGLKADGTVVAVGDNNFGQCNVRGWKDIVAISADDFRTAGLKSDGTVVVTSEDNSLGQCLLDDWNDIVAISAGGSAGLKADGTVVLTSNDTYDVTSWKDIVAISSGMFHIVGLRADGTVVAVGDNDHGQCNVAGWRDMIAISAGRSHTVGLKADGSVIATKYIEKDIRYTTYEGQCKVDYWRLFKNYDNLEQELKEARIAKQKQDAEILQRKAWGLCQHCGGEFRGLFSKKCANCGKSKDY